MACHPVFLLPAVLTAASQRAEDPTVNPALPYHAGHFPAVAA
jgi:hypothetical protein